MPNFIDLTGQRFGAVEVLHRAPNSSRNEVMWLCRCDCGTEFVTRARSLRSGETTSCECLRREHAVVAMKKANTRHGVAPHRGYTKLYNTWLRMKGRCNIPTATSYKYYGGRGISVCKEWENDFAAFRDWALANGYQEGLSIDRIDVNGDYCPENCRWIAMADQQRNKRPSSEWNFKNHKGKD